MGIRKGFKESTVPVIVAFAILVPANVVSWVAFTTASWAYLDAVAVNYQGYGLWRICATTGSCSLLDGTRSEWYAAFQAFGVVGFSGLNVALFLVVMYMFVEWCQKDVELKVAAIVSCFVGAVGYIITVVVFSQMIRGWIANSQDLKLGFSLWLAVAAIILAAISGAMLVVDACVKKGKFDTESGVTGNSSSGENHVLTRSKGKVSALAQSGQTRRN